MHGSLINLFIGLVIVVLVATGLTAMIMEWARSGRLLDVPNPRSSHRHPTPSGGGAVIAGLGILSGVAWFLSVSTETPGRLAAAVWAGFALLLTAVSFADDLRPRPAILRLAVHTLAATAILGVTPGWQILALPGLAELQWGILGTFILFLWIVGLTNLYNFMDGIDGLAGIQAVVASAGWILLGTALDEPLLLWLGTTLGGASIAFLIFNWPPARLFMGDVGSAFLGFTFAALPLLALALDPSRNTTMLIACAALVVWPFLFDGLYTLARRIRRRENLFQAHRGHLYQRLVSTGLGHGHVSRVYGFLSLFGVVLTLFWVREDAYSLAITLPTIATLGLFLVLWTRIRESRNTGGQGTVTF